MKIRLQGTHQECQQAAPRLAEVFDVVSVSDPYPNRGRNLLVRVYVQVRLGRGRDVHQDEAAAPAPVTIHRAGRVKPCPRSTPARPRPAPHHPGNQSRMKRTSRENAGALR